MKYESSYECGRKPFRPDKERGQWSRHSDFIIVAIGLIFKMDLFVNEIVNAYKIGPLGILAYLITMALYIVPVMIIQSFLGQFSSSGLISALRLSPIFKGLGYCSTILNMFSLSISSFYVVIPLYFLINSFRPILPWSCEVMVTKLNASMRGNTCNTSDDMFVEPASATYFAQSHGEFHEETGEFVSTINWQFVLLNILTWSALAVFFVKYYKMPVLGKLLRNIIIVTFVLMLICMIRFLFLPNMSKHLTSYFSYHNNDIFFALIVAPIVGLASFGAGWGSIITLSSFNKFNTNIMRASWFICLGQMLGFFSFSFTSHLIEGHIENIANASASIARQESVLYFSSGSVLADMSLPNLWSILYFTMLTLAALISMITQFISLSTSLFDEFEILRTNRKRNVLILICITGLLSFPVCKQMLDVGYITYIITVLLCQSMIHLIILFIVLWVYGRERFQRDMEFMLHSPFANWKIFTLRYISPIFLLHIFLGSSAYLFFQDKYAMFAWILAALTIFIITGYGIYIVLQTTGSIWLRLKRCCRPNDWYPVDMDDRQRYEDALGNVDITHQLNEVTLETEA